MSYARHSEQPVSWHLSCLGRGLDDQSDAKQPFYPASQFALPGRPSINFPSHVGISTNHFNPKLTGDRRLKNAVMAIEWVPNSESAAVPILPAMLTDVHRGQLLKVSFTRRWQMLTALMRRG